VAQGLRAIVMKGFWVTNRKGTASQSHGSGIRKIGREGWRKWGNLETVPMVFGG